MSFRVKIELMSLYLFWKGRKGENGYVEESKIVVFATAFFKKLRRDPKAFSLFCDDSEIIFFQCACCSKLKFFVRSKPSSKVKKLIYKTTWMEDSKQTI